MFPTLARLIVKIDGQDGDSRHEINNLSHFLLVLF